jgi:hypothetical protein
MSTSIEIPFVSDLYRWATGNDLTLLDLVALLVAIPAGFVLKLASREPAYASGVSPLPPTELPAVGTGTPPPGGWVEIVAGIAQVIWGTLNGVVSALGVVMAARYGTLPDSGMSPFAKARLAFTIAGLFVVRSLFLSAAILAFVKDKSWIGILAWALPTLVIAADCLFIWRAGPDPDSNLGMTFLAAIVGGIGMLIVGIVLVFYLGRSGASQWLGACFVFAVSIAYMCRSVAGIFGVTKEVEKQLVGVGLVAGFLAISGALQIARGAVQS